MARGGKRPNAGRKPSTIKGLVKKLGKFDAEALLAKINQNQKWEELSKDADPRVRLETLKYLCDRAYGKAKQAVDLGGELKVDMAQRSNADLAYFAAHGIWPEQK